MELTHIGENGECRMVDVSGKNETVRIAVAQAMVSMKPVTLKMILQNEMPKGDVLAAARIAGIMAAKKTPDLIPMCHNISLKSVEVLISKASNTQLHIEASVKCKDVTGVEMEALTAVSVAALTIYDMCKAVDRFMRIDEVFLVEKNGGKSGHFVRTVEKEN